MPQQFGVLILNKNTQKIEWFKDQLSNDVVVNFNDVIRNAHCALNIESTQPVAILSFEWTL